MKNPFRVDGKDTVQVRVHKDMIKVLTKKQATMQKEADVKFGKGKFKVRLTKVSHKLARSLL